MARSPLSRAQRESVVPLALGTSETARQAIARELPTEFALPVWQALSSLLRWAMEEPALRGDLFEASSMREWEEQLLRESWEVELRAAVVVIVGDLADPSKASPEALAHACMCVVEWALAHDYSATVLGFVEAAALCMPENPGYAWLVGRFLRSNGSLREAAFWLKRAERTAAARNDREVQIRALNSLGNLHSHMTRDLKAAAKCHHDSLRLARRYQKLDREGELLHDLFVVSWYSGDADAAEEYARQALAVYGPDHARLPALAHDLASCWMWQGYYARAAAILRETIHHFTDGTESIRAVAAYARAVAGAGDSAGFSSLAAEVWRRVDDRATGLAGGIALIELVCGAASLSDWPVAQRALERAVEIASRGDAAELRSETDALLSAVDRRVATPPGKHDDIANPLAADVLLALRKRTTGAAERGVESGSQLN
jgi:tetratricopeptide (TPR) repeat protein